MGENLKKIQSEKYTKRAEARREQTYLHFSRRSILGECMCYKERKRRLEVVGCNVEALGSLLNVCIVEQLNPKSEKNATSFCLQIDSVIMLEPSQIL